MTFALALIMTGADGLKHVLAKMSSERVSINMTHLLWTSAALLLYLIIAIFVGINSIPESTWATLFVVAAVIAIGSYFYLQGLHLSDISLSVPMLSISPIITSVVNYYVTGEVLMPINLIGIICVAVGIYLLYDHRNPLAFITDIMKNRGAIFVLIASICWGVIAAFENSLVDELGALTYVVHVNAIILGMFVLRILFSPGGFKELWQNLTDKDVRPEGTPIVSGVVDAIAVLVQLHLFTILNPAQVMGFKRASLLVGEFFAAGMLHERLAGRIFPTLIIVAGAILSLI